MPRRGTPGAPVEARNHCYAILQVFAPSFIAIGLFASVWAGCKPPAPETTPETVLATAYGASLTASELMAELPAGLTQEDSTARAGRAITDWLQRQTLAHLALTELPLEERDFARAVNRYRESLLIHAYEDRYLRDHLDTLITDAELQSFLNEQPDLFRLSEPLFRARWIVFPQDAPFPRDIRDLTKQLKSKDAEVLSALTSRCLDAGMPHDLEAERWWTWSELSAILPLNPKWASRQQSTQRVTRIDWKADTAAGRPFDERALLLVTERLAAGDVSPVERVADRITELLLHRRRNLTLAEMRQQAVQAAWAEAALTTAAPTADVPASAAPSADVPATAATTADVPATAATTADTPTDRPEFSPDAP